MYAGWRYVLAWGGLLVALLACVPRSGTPANGAATRPPSAPPSAVLYSATTRGEFNHWTLGHGWTVRRGALVNDGKGSPGDWMASPPFRVPHNVDYAIEVRMQGVFVGPVVNDSASFGVVALWFTIGNCLMVNFGTFPSPPIFIDCGQPVNIGDDPGVTAYYDGAPHRYRVEVRGVTCSMWIDGRYYARASTHTLDVHVGAHVGLGSYATKMTVWSFKVLQLSPPRPLPTATPTVTPMPTSDPRITPLSVTPATGVAGQTITVRIAPTLLTNAVGWALQWDTPPTFIAQGLGPPPLQVAATIPAAAPGRRLITLYRRAPGDVMAPPGTSPSLEGGPVATVPFTVCAAPACSAPAGPTATPMDPARAGRALPQTRRTPGAP